MPNDGDDMRSVRSLSQITLSQASNEEYAQIRPGDQIKLSWIDIRYQIKSAKPGWFTRIFRPKQYREWREDGGEEIIHGMLGEIEPGEIVAIMGGSGAGKTTMLNVLAGRVQTGHPSGIIRVNNGLRNPHEWPRLMSYVEQMDQMDPDLSVKEIIEFSSNILLPTRTFTREQKEKKAKKVIESLGLSGVLNQRPGSLSDGQRKLLSIAIQICAERRIIFLDEPTTGQDSSSAIDLIKTLKDLAKKYCLSVILSVHQPRAKILREFSRILLMTQGKAVYYGTLEEILRHLQTVTGEPLPMHENPADYILDMVSLESDLSSHRDDSQKRVDKLVKAWHEIEMEHNLTLSEEYHQKSRASSTRSSRAASILKSDSRSSFRRSLVRSSGVSTSSRRSVTSMFLSRADSRVEWTGFGWPVSRWEEFCLLLRRYWMVETRNIRNGLTLFIGFSLLGLLYGFVYFQLTTENFGGFQSRVGLFNQICSTIMFIITADLSRIFVNSRPLMRREWASKTYRTTSAFAARFITLLPVRMVTIAVFGTIIYYLSGLRTDSFIHYLIFLGYIELLLISLISFGLIISAYSRTLFNALLGTIVLTGIFSAFGGVALRSANIPGVLRWIRYLSPYFYANSGMAQNELDGITIAGQSGSDFIELYGLAEVSPVWAAAGLVLMSLGYLMIACYCLYNSTRTRFIII